MKQGCLITKWTPLNPKNNNCREMDTWTYYKCSFGSAAPICPTWVKSHWFWTIERTLYSLINYPISLKKWPFRQEAVKVDCSNKIQHQPSEVTHMCCYTRLLLMWAIKQLTHIHDRIYEQQGNQTTQHMTVRPWITTVNHRALYLDLPELHDRFN